MSVRKRRKQAQALGRGPAKDFPFVRINRYGSMRRSARAAHAEKFSMIGHIESFRIIVSAP